MHAMMRVASGGRPKPVTLECSRVIAIKHRQQLSDLLDNLEEDYFKWVAAEPEFTTTYDDLVEYLDILADLDWKIKSINELL